MITIVSYGLYSSFLPIEFQLKRLQDQVSSLKTSNENHQKQSEELVSKLKEVCVWYFSQPVPCFQSVFIYTETII